MPQGPFGIANIIRFATYRVADVGRAAYANTGPLWQLVGSASKKVKLRKVKIVARATATTQLDLVINKRTSLNAGASLTALGASYDDADGAPGALASVITNGPTAYGTLQGAVDGDQIIIEAAGGTVVGGDVVFDFSLYDLWGPSKAPTLNNATEMFEINIGGGTGTWTTVAGNNFDMSMVWTEGG